MPETGVKGISGETDSREGPEQGRTFVAEDQKEGLRTRAGGAGAGEATGSNQMILVCVLTRNLDFLLCATKKD